MEINLELHPRQARALQVRANEILFGGAAGGGKSHFLRVLSIILALSVKGIQIYLFRRVRDDLIKTHVEGPSGYKVLLADLVAAKVCKVVKDEIRFSNGSMIYLCHCKDVGSEQRYLSCEMHALLIDEAVKFEEQQVRFLRTRVRMTGIDVPKQWEGKLPMMVYATNPVGPLHTYLQEGFVDAAQPEEVFQAPLDDGGFLRAFIPSKLDDNPSMPEEYGRTLEGIGSPDLVKAYRDGDWHVVFGAFFSELRRELHTIQPFPIPAWWTRFRAIDWGVLHPCCLWFAVSDGTPVKGFDETYTLRKGDIVVYREWYPSAGKSTTQTKWNADDAVREILRLSEGEEIAYTMADPSMIERVSEAIKGPTIGEVFHANGLYLTSAMNSRVQGWQEVRRRIKNRAVRISTACPHTFRTLSLLPHDEKNAEDADTKAEDHPCDAMRYGLTSWMWAKSEEQEAQQGKYITVHGPSTLTAQDLFRERGFNVGY